MAKNKVSFKLKSKLSELDTLCQNLERFGQSIGLSPKCIFEANLALDELFTNIITYGFKDKKEHTIIYYKTVNAESYSVRDSDGCSWTRMTSMFAPTLEWYDCYQERSGTQEIINTMGNPWPLREKTEFQYEFTGKWNDGFGAKWHQTRKCKVDKQVRVKVPAGEFDTYKLICEDPSLKWTYWISPKLGHRVAFELENKSFLSRSYMLELVKVVNP